MRRHVFPSCENSPKASIVSRDVLLPNLAMETSRILLDALFASRTMGNASKKRKIRNIRKKEKTPIKRLFSQTVSFSQPIHEFFLACALLLLNIIIIRSDNEKLLFVFFTPFITIVRIAATRLCNLDFCVIQRISAESLRPRFISTSPSLGIFLLQPRHVP